MDERAKRISHILDCTSSLFRITTPAQNQAWQSVDLTMPQLKTMMCVLRTNGSTSGQVARSLGVGLSTVTGIVDRLTEQGLVTRREDAEDRRITRLVPTAAGRRLYDDLLRYREEAITTLLSRLDERQLEVVEQAFEYLGAAASAMIGEPRQEEVVA
jgi:DNA-binding MarR family transcriptional regulator